jgi:hypothetical protein
MLRSVSIVCIAAVFPLVGSLIIGGQLAQASPTGDQAHAYGLVDPNIDGNGSPGFAFEENMASVRRVSTGHYCLRSSVHFDHGPVVRVSVDGTAAPSRIAVAVSDLRASYCDKSRQEAAVITYLVINGRARLSNTIRFVADALG